MRRADWWEDENQRFILWGQKVPQEKPGHFKDRKEDCAGVFLEALSHSLSIHQSPAQPFLIQVRSDGPELFPGFIYEITKP